MDAQQAQAQVAAVRQHKMKNALIIFVKNLVYGSIKTRLAATLGNRKAYEIYQILLHHTACVTKQINTDKYIFYSSEIVENDIWNDLDIIKRIQHGKDLGERMLQAFTDVCKNDYEKTVVIGSDCMEISTSHIYDSYLKLDEADVVIGPAEDGGYYLLGMKRLYPELFTNIYWSTNEVLKQTIEICEHKNLTYKLLEQLSDIDDEKDWLKMKEHVPKKIQLLFVYNANSNIFSTVTDYTHKILSPATYQCNLCALTHSNFGMKQQWKNFIDELPVDKNFLHKDDFIRQYPVHKEKKFPAVLIKKGALISEFLTASQINSFKSINELKQVILAKLHIA